MLRLQLLEFLTDCAQILNLWSELALPLLDNLVNLSHKLGDLLQSLSLLFINLSLCSGNLLQRVCRLLEPSHALLLLLNAQHGAHLLLLILKDPLGAAEDESLCIEIVKLLLKLLVFGKLALHSFILILPVLALEDVTLTLLRQRGLLLILCQQLTLALSQLVQLCQNIFFLLGNTLLDLSLLTKLQISLITVRILRRVGLFLQGLDFRVKLLALPVKASKVALGVYRLRQDLLQGEDSLLLLLHFLGKLLVHTISVAAGFLHELSQEGCAGSISSAVANFSQACISPLVSVLRCIELLSFLAQTVLEFEFFLLLTTQSSR
mmetsp:Transcript_38618/g.46743  ORF Transcript_38618/g.46743 Transcript_38618/m.46743 type:complete len:321 (-) Transcript_38618:785-1747(-)